MPHLTLYALEPQLAGREDALVAGLTDAVVAVYGEWARRLVAVRLVGVPSGRWAVGGVRGENVAPSVEFGIKAGALARPDGPEIAGRLAAGVTDVLAEVFGERFRDDIMIEFHPQHDARIALGGRLLDAAGSA
ncbi:4-oxalocrotonate tautomerase family protein [Nocardia sp. NPDC004068]|uniref:tautomerase family protein n=1 Tax=Nocardia sp. NPDC004068 TaxID=3364303 RepID=UPI0036C4F905